MQITHEDAHQLIQFRMDQTLRAQEQNILETHLKDCKECRTFAEELQELEHLLTPVMKRQWSLDPTLLSIEAIAQKRKTQLPSGIMFATRTVLISLAFAALFFSVWQFSLSGSRALTPMPVGALPVPTPSGHSTSTRISFQNCQEVIYDVQENDTLANIASQFSISEDKIMDANGLRSETLSANMELLIPICSSTPTGTVRPSTLTTTFTPFFGPATSTPGG